LFFQTLVLFFGGAGGGPPVVSMYTILVI